jgi:pimeloyl-ACP methyl ester carboxylesterase
VVGRAPGSVAGGLPRAFGRTFPGTAASRRLVAGALLLGLGLLLLAPTGRGITVEDVRVGADGALPVRVYVPDAVRDRDAADTRSAPGVVVAHGFAGSAMLMHSWSLALAHAGFVVVAPDLPGHGASGLPLAGPGGALPEAVLTALTHLRSLDAVDADRVALLGHSMGSGAVLAAGIERSDLVRAVVAVSPTDAAVTPTAPRDLLLMAGANEGRFVANAETLLERAGGRGGEPGEGDARELLVVPRVEHVSILFSPTSFDVSIAWLAAALDHAPTGRAPTGPLAGWALLAVGIILVWQALVRQGASPAIAPDRRAAPWLALPVGGVAATASLVILERSLELEGMSGLLVAGEVGLWFLMTGAVWLRFGVRPAAPEGRDLGWAILAIALVVGLGATSRLAWAPWWLEGARVSTALLLAVLLLPFGLASASMLHGRQGRSALVVWLASAGSVAVTLGAAAFVVPGLGFLILILPLLPLVLAATTAVSVGMDRPWAAGTATAVLLAWLLAMIFPLA